MAAEDFVPTRVYARAGWLLAYWALGRDPTEADEEFLERFVEIVGESSIPEAAAEVGDAVRATFELNGAVADAVQEED